VGRALRVCLGKRCILLLFFAGFKQGSPGFLDPQGRPRHHHWYLVVDGNGNVAYRLTHNADKS
jgi:hypothetical protein